MPNNDRDWLDEKLMVQDYIPEDGFTARVVTRLPKTRSSLATNLRTRILFVAGFLAACLLALQTISVARQITGWTSRDSAMELSRQMIAVMHQPGVIYGGAACVLVLGLAVLPFLRRWI